MRALTQATAVGPNRDVTEGRLRVGALENGMPFHGVRSQDHRVPHELHKRGEDQEQGLGARKNPWMPVEYIVYHVKREIGYTTTALERATICISGLQDSRRQEAVCR